MSSNEVFKKSLEAELSKDYVERSNVLDMLEAIYHVIDNCHGGEEPMKLCKQYQQELSSSTEPIESEVEDELRR